MNRIQPGDIVMITLRVMPRLGMVLEIYEKEKPLKDIARVHVLKHNKAYNFHVIDLEKINHKNI